MNGMWGWRRKNSPESGTGQVAGTSETEEGTSDVELGTDMTAVTADPLGQALAERATLIQLCMYALDRARSTGVVERLAEGLSGIGVAPLRPDGTRFDPALHEAGGTLPTDDPALDGVIAETEVLGFADRDRILRAPIVTVYQLRKQ
ncbi:GrpE protein [Saccharopolyspora antimicrobica]|uniref:GrpE protein n=3 Tax=Saccharopolyspora TaxID=1835 RepID=A0A1I4XK17_9PSEU|nr:GrpE protein [Saccharopolyspora antimicrobica]SFN26122.1 GrpE protein [Saccharopolyspora antimicrobica]